MPAPEPDESRQSDDVSAGESLSALAADIREFLALVKLRFLLVETRVARLEQREAPAVAPPLRRPCRRPRRRGPHAGGGCGEMAPLP